MDSPEWLTEFRLLLTEYGLNKVEFLALFVFIIIMMRLPTILTHHREMAVIKADYAIRGTKLEAKIKAQETKQLTKAAKGKRK